MFKQNQIRWDEIGVIGHQTDQDVVDASRLVQKGIIYPLGTERFMHMPVGLFAPPFMLYTMHSVHGTKNAKSPEREWIWNQNKNKSHIGFNADYFMAGSHTGTHIDSLAHATIGEDAHWYNGFTSEEYCCDNGVLKADASSMLPVFTRGVLVDVAGDLGVSRVPDDYIIDSSVIQNIMRKSGLEIQSGDTVLIHTGYENDYPDIDIDLPVRRAGLDESAADYLAQIGVAAVGIDTEYMDCVPSKSSENPYPVHTRLLIESGIHILENVLTKHLSMDQQKEFLFVALPLTNRGATASMVNPIAVV